ncbi:unnamed protein product, partial [Mycena citricolor]
AHKDPRLLQITCSIDAARVRFSQCILFNWLHILLCGVPSYCVAFRGVMGAYFSIEWSLVQG